MTDMEPEIRKAVDERIDCINQVTDLCRKRGPEAIQKPIDEIDDEHLRSMIYVLIIARAGDHDRYAEMLKTTEALKSQVREHYRKGFLREIHEADQPTEQEEKIMALENHIVSLEMQILAMARPSQN